MTIEKLKALLESGAITQEEFDEMAANIAEPAPSKDPEPTQDPEPSKDPEPTDDKFDRLIQAKLDRAMAKERKEKADLKKQLEKLQKKMLTDEEAKQLEFENQQKELEEQRRELTLEKNKMYAVKSMKKANISDSEEMMSLMEQLVRTCEDETEIDDTIELLASCINKQVEKKVDEEVKKRFKDNAYTPKKSDNLNGGVNPWKKDQWNVTAQMSIMMTNPELAKQLQAAAGA